MDKNDLKIAVLRATASAALSIAARLMAERTGKSVSREHQELRDMIGASIEKAFAARTADARSASRPASFVDLVPAAPH